MRYAVFLLVAALVQSLHAAVLDEEQRLTLRDTEDGDLDDAGGSGEESTSENSWVRYSRNGGVRLATVDEVNLLERYVLSRPDIFTEGQRARLESYAGEQMEDGPDKLDPDDHVNPRPTAEREESLPVAGTVLDVVASTNFYPEFAVGLLDNGCTAFLIGPRHALTSAHCVYNYNSSSFSDNLDMWRGRNSEMYLSRMTWSDAIIPRDYYLSATDQDDWALVIYTKPSSSRVWLKIGFSENIYNVPYTMFGYLSSKIYGVMHSTVCRSRVESAPENPDDDQLLNVQCGSDECFDGGPLLRGYNFQRSKMPVAYGISLSTCDSYSFSHNNVIFQPDLFWSLCYFMSAYGFDAQCSLKSS